MISDDITYDIGRFFLINPSILINHMDISDYIHFLVKKRFELNEARDYFL